MSCEIPGPLRKPEVRRILKAIKEGEVTEFKPSLSYERGVFYPKIDKILPDLNLDYGFLEDLERYGILRKEFYDAIVTCPSCGSHRLILKLRCPSCGSTRLNKGSMIEHFRCGYVDLEDRFLKGENLVCPKCGKELRMLGVDYRRPGVFFKCGSCGSITAIPDQEYVCSDCEKKFDLEELSIKEMFTFKVEPHRRPLIEMWSMDFGELAEVLGKAGYIVKCPATLKGASGVEHNFEFALLNPETPNNVEYVMDVELEENEINEVKVLSFFAKAFDVKAKRKILVAIPKLNQRAREMAKNYKITVLENLSPKDIPSAVLEAIKKKKDLL